MTGTNGQRCLAKAREIGAGRFVVRWRNIFRLWRAQRPLTDREKWGAARRASVGGVKC